MHSERGRMILFRAALCGNPNVGKSTVFNALTGLKQHTGNWSGKTVETACGFFSDGEEKWQLTDLPGTYSLLNGSPEEQLASENLLNEVSGLIPPQVHSISVTTVSPKAENPQKTSTSYPSPTVQVWISM